jgi:riboflavin synthase
MFTGLVQAVGRVASMTRRSGDVELVIDSESLPLEAVAIGDSIAVSGVCLTVTRLESRSFAADVSVETLGCTTLGHLTAGSPVNLEGALRVGDPLGGHYVTGHVDGVAQVVALTKDARSLRVSIEVPATLARFVAVKGSVTLEGTSLTVNEVHGRVFGVNLIPHTQSVTTLGALVLGQSLNIEVDLIARYVERAFSLSAMTHSVPEFGVAAGGAARESS